MYYDDIDNKDVIDCRDDNEENDVENDDNNNNSNDSNNIDNNHDSGDFNLTAKEMSEKLDRLRIDPCVQHLSTFNVSEWFFALDRPAGRF